MKPNMNDVILSIYAKRVLCRCTKECKEQKIHHKECPCPEHFGTYKEYLRKFTKKELIDIINATFIGN